MGWGDCGTDSKGRPIGYAHAATCDHPGCKAKIDRGVGHACGEMHGTDEGGCEGYFCEEHLYHVEDPFGWVGRQEGFAVVCEACKNEHNARLVEDLMEERQEEDMPFSEAVISKLTSPPTPEDVRHVTKDVYAIEPIRYGGKYGDPDYRMLFDSLSPEAQAKCAQFAETSISSWQRLVLGSAPSKPEEPTDAQLARVRETIASVIDEWRLSYRVERHKTHWDLESLLVGAMWAMHLNGTITINQQAERPAG